jgi:hypothetical protein
LLLKKKTKKSKDFINGLHNHIVGDPQFRKKTEGKSETQIQTEIRPIIINYLVAYFSKLGFKDPSAKANKSFYWEGQEGKFGKERASTFGARNYPDFIITDPYLVAIEYKQSPNGSTVKQGIGQSLMHTLTEDFHYVYYLFHDESRDKKIENASKSEKEQKILDQMWANFNVFIKFV